MPCGGSLADSTPRNDERRCPHLPSLTAEVSRKNKPRIEHPARACVHMYVCVCARARCVAFLARATGVKIGRVKCSGLSTWLDPLPTRNPSLSSQKSQIFFLAVEARACSSCQTSAEVGTKGPFQNAADTKEKTKKKNNK